MKITKKINKKIDSSLCYWTCYVCEYDKLKPIDYKRWGCNAILTVKKSIPTDKNPWIISKT